MRVSAVLSFRSYIGLSLLLFEFPRRSDSSRSQYAAWSVFTQRLALAIVDASAWQSALGVAVSRSVGLLIADLPAGYITNGRDCCKPVAA